MKFNTRKVKLLIAEQELTLDRLSKKADMHDFADKLHAAHAIMDEKEARQNQVKKDTQIRFTA